MASEAFFGITARVASAQTLRAFHVELDGQNLGQMIAPSGGWQVWGDRTWVNIRIAAGNHTLRVVFDNGLVNLNYIELTQNAPTCSDAVKNGPETDVDCGGGCPTLCAKDQDCAQNSDCASNDCQKPVASTWAARAGSIWTASASSTLAV